MAGRIEQSAYVIHRRPWLEDAELVECLTPDYGKIPLIRKKTSKPLPLFQELTIEFTGRSEQKRLHEWLVSGAVHQLSGQLSYYGLYVNELIYHLVGRYDQNPLIYGLYSSTMHLLQHSPESLPVLRYFEKTLLEQLGYGLDWSMDIHGDRISADKSYHFYVGNGFALATTSEAVISGAILLAIRQNDWSHGDALLWAKRIFTTEINRLLQGRILKSRELFETVIK